MKTTIGLMFLATTLSLNASATVKAYVCYGHCLGVNTAYRSISFLGSTPAAAETRMEAWAKRNRQCEKRARRYETGPLLAKNYVTANIDQSSTTTYDAETFYFRRYTLVNSTTTVYQNDVFQLSVDLLGPQDCVREDVSEEFLEEYYEGPLPVRG